MAMSKQRTDREYAKFKETPSGETAVRICNDSDTPLVVEADVTVVTGISGPIKITGSSVTDSSAGFPATNQSGRNSISIRNIDTAESIWIVNSTGITKAGAGVDIWEVGPDETFNMDMDDTNKINLVADTGKTVSIQIMEIKK